MIRNVPLGIFYPGDSLLHRLQARTKLLIIFWFMITLIIANQRQWHFAPYIVVLALVLLGTFLGGIPLREMWQRLWLLVILTFMGTVITLLTGYRDYPALYTLGPWKPLYGPLHDQLLFSGIVCVVLVLSAFVPGTRKLWQTRWMKRLRGFLLVACVAIILFLWLTSDSAPDKPFPIGPIIITYRGVWILMASFVVFLVMYMSSILLTMTTMPVALIEGLTMLLSPLRRLKLPVNDFALMALLALRFVPTLLEEAEQLIKAQTSRGADVMHGTVRERLQSLSMFFLPLVQGTLRRASELSIALDARGYQSEGASTRLHESQLGLIDYLSLAIVIIVTVVSLIFF